MSTSLKQRLIHLDVLRGVAILMILYCHICNLLLVEPAAAHNNGTILSGVFSNIMLPIFFFIGGYFLYRPDYNSSTFKRHFFSRFVSQLIPTLILMIIFCMIFREGDISGAFHNDFKYGYWFPFVYAVMFLFGAGILLMLAKIDGGNKYLLTFILISLGLGAYSIEILHFWHKTRWFGPKEIWDTLSLELLLYHTPFYVFGCICAIYKQVFEKITTRYGLVICGLFFVCYFLHVPFITPFLGIVAAYYACHKLATSSYNFTKKISTSIAYIGQLTLEIYLIHYFILYGAKATNVLAPLRGLKNTILEFPVFLILALLMVIAVIAVVKILEITKVKRFIFPN